MGSNGNGRGGLLTAGGVLSILAGISQIICGAALIVDYLVSYLHYYRLIDVLFLPLVPDAWRYYVLWGGWAIPASMDYIPIRWAIIGGCLGVLGIIAIIGGVSAIRRKSFGLSLAGAICALPSVYFSLFLAWVFSALAAFIMVILAVIFVALGKREFSAERKRNGI